MSARGWARSIGISSAAFRGRLARWGPRHERTFRPRQQKRRAQNYEWNGTTLTAARWARALGVTNQAFHYRLKIYGPNNHRTFMTKTPNVPLDLSEDVAVAGHNERVMPAADAAARITFLNAVLAEFPAFGEDTEEGIRTAEIVADIIGPLSCTEVAHVLGISRQRVQQIEYVAMKKAKLAGGRELREHYEATAPLVSAWDELELYG